jgi:16S rRNA (guanine(966)-N(2))-methyltransferase RsmD
MSDKARGALFNVLGDISGLSVLDGFAGSGALGFEAISRGATTALAIENDKSAQRAIAENIEQLGLTDKMRLVKANIGSWSDNNPAQTFDIVLCDPPYDKLQLTTLQKLARHLAPGGTYILSWPGDLTAPELVGLKIVATKNYAGAQLVFYQKTG